jgi:hypothetical protein
VIAYELVIDETPGTLAPARLAQASSAGLAGGGEIPCLPGLTPSSFGWELAIPEWAETLRKPDEHSQPVFFNPF